LSANKEEVNHHKYYILMMIEEQSLSISNPGIIEKGFIVPLIKRPHKRFMKLLF